MRIGFFYDTHHSHHRTKLFATSGFSPEKANGVGTGVCRPRDQETIPHTVNEWVRPQPNPLAILRETMACSNCKPCFIHRVSRAPFPAAKQLL
jgi:hypothetical protein